MRLISLTSIRAKLRIFRLRLRFIYYFLRFTYAFIKTFLWGYWRVISGIIAHPLMYLYALEDERKARNEYCFTWDRWESPEPIYCPECEWAGQVKNLIHTYYYNQINLDDEEEDNLELIDECPNCGLEL